MAKVFLFNPYTGTPRHPSDIASDPEGLAIVDETEPLRAAKAATPAAARCANGPMGCDYPRCDCNGASTKESGNG